MTPERIAELRAMDLRVFTVLTAGFTYYDANPIKDEMLDEIERMNAIWSDSIERIKQRCDENPVFGDWWDWL